MFRYLVIESIAAPSTSHAPALTDNPLKMVLWLPSAKPLDAASIGTRILTQSDIGSKLTGYSMGEGAFLGEGSMVLGLYEATPAELHQAMDAAKKLFPGSFGMSFEAPAGFDLEASVWATLEAMNLPASTPKAPNAGRI